MALLLVSCAEEQSEPAEDAGPSSITINELWTSPGNEEFGFLATVIVGGMLENGGEVWVGDPRGGHVLVLDRSGDPLRVLGARGEGPGEFQSVAGLVALPDRTAAVYDISASALHVFTADGQFVKRVVLEPRFINPKGFAADSEGFFISSGLPGSEHAIHRLDLEGALVESWHPIPVANAAEVPEEYAASNEIYVAGGPISLAANGDLLLSEAAPHRILRFASSDREGVVVAERPNLLESVVNTFTTVEENSVTFDWLFPQSRGVFELADGSILNIVTIHEDDRSVWEVYSASGELVAVEDVPRAYFPWGMTSEGAVLVSYENAADGNPLVGEVRFEVE